MYSFGEFLNCPPATIPLRVGQSRQLEVSFKSGKAGNFFASNVSRPELVRMEPLQVENVKVARFTASGRAPAAAGESSGGATKGPLGESQWTIIAVEDTGSDFCQLTFEVSTDDPPPPPPPPVEVHTFFAHLGHVGVGDPIEPATGELFFGEALDLYLGGPLPLYFGRYHAARLERDGVIAGALGPNWLHNFDWRLTQDASTVRIGTSLGRLIQFAKTGATFTQTGAVDLPFQLALSGAHLVLGDPRSGLRRSFDGQGRLVEVADGKGNSHTLSYAGNLLARVVDGLGRRLDLGYDGGGRLREVTDGARTVSFGYAGAQLASATDAAGNLHRYTYTSAGGAGGLLVARDRPEGNTPFEQAWDGEGRVAEQTDGTGNRHRLDYVAGSTTVTDPLGRQLVHAHGAALLATGMTDKQGERVTRTLDGTGRRATHTDRLGGTMVTTYHPQSGRLATLTNPAGSTFTFTYSERVAGGLSVFDLTRVTFPDGSSEAYSYDAAGNLTRFTDAAGGEWSFTHDDRGRRLTATNPLGGTTTYAYNADRTLASRRDPAGNPTTFTYDALRRPIAVTHPDGATRTVTYDELDRITTLTDETGAVWSFAYDRNGRLVRATDPLGQSRTLSYDDLDRLVRESDPLGKATRRTYDRLGNVASVSDRSGRTTDFGYDALDRLVAMRDPAGRTWTRGANAEGIPSFIADPLSNAWRFVTDGMGRLVRARSPEGDRTHYRYDAMGRLREAIDPGRHSTLWSFDPRGLVTAVARAGGAIQGAFAYDAAGQVVAKTDANGNVWRWERDAQGRPLRRTDPLGNVVTYEYDSRNRLARITLPAGLGTRELTYDGRDRLVSRRASDGTEVTYTYDEVGRLVAASGITLAYDAASRPIASNGLTAAYDADGRLTRVTLVPGRSVSYEYDEAGRLIQVRDWLGGRTRLVYDEAGRLVALERPNGVDTSLAYDRNGALAEIVEGALARITLERDANGRVVATERDLPLDPAPPDEIVELAYDAASRVVHPAFAYDALGRLVADGLRSYTWDLASRLRRVSSAAGGPSASYTYDAFDRRLTRILDGTTRSYTWSYLYAAPRVAVERQGGQPLRFYVHTPDGLPLYRVEAESNARRFYHYDQAGNVVFLSDDRGAVVRAYAYDPFGRRLASSPAAISGKQDVPGLDGIEPDDTVTAGGAEGGLSDGPFFPLVLRGGARPYLPTLQASLLPGLGDPFGFEHPFPAVLGGDAAGFDPFAEPGSDGGRYVSYRIASNRPWGFNVARDILGREGYSLPWGAPDFGLSAAAHELKFGAGYRQVEPQSQTVWSPPTFSDATFTEPHQAAFAGVYIQDQISSGNFTVNAGLRYDPLPEGDTVAGSPFGFGQVPGTGFLLGGEGTLGWQSVAPRLGSSYELGADRNAFQRGSYALFADQLGSGASAQDAFLGGFGASQVGGIPRLEVLAIDPFVASPQQAGRSATPAWSASCEDDRERIRQQIFGQPVPFQVR